MEVSEYKESNIDPDEKAAAELKPIDSPTPSHELVLISAVLGSNKESCENSLDSVDDNPNEHVSLPELEQAISKELDLVELSLKHKIKLTAPPRPVRRSQMEKLNFILVRSTFNKQNQS